MKIKMRAGLIFAAIFIASCSNSRKHDTDRTFISETFPATALEPVSRDFSDIKDSGVLRMITSYSSGTYFLHRGLQVGFEYELVKKFTEENDLALEVIIPGPNESPYDLLNRGEGDIIAAHYTITEERKNIVQFTRPYNLVNQYLIFNSELFRDSLNSNTVWEEPVAIRRNSSYYPRLMQLREEGIPVSVELVSDEMDTEAMLYLVSNGSHSSTIADENIYEAASRYMDNLVKGPVIAESDTIAWAIRKNAPDLEANLNRFLYKHFRFGEEGSVKRSEFLNILRKRYFENGLELENYYNPEASGLSASSLSPYDVMIREVSREFELDWILMTALIAQESRFNPTAESWAGAIGLMQVLPRFSDISKDSLFIPEVNLREGARILKEHMLHYAYLDSANQVAFALASYNVGAGHLADARRLVIDSNKDPNNWENVAEALLRLMQGKYHQHARHGFARGIETVRYVKEILNRHKTYTAILAHSESRVQLYGSILGIKTFNLP